MPMEEDDLFCTRCGKPVEESTGEKDDKEEKIYDIEEEIYEEEQSVTFGRKWIIGAAAAAVVLLVFFIGLFQVFSGGEKEKAGETDGQTASEQIDSGKEQVSGETGQELTADAQKNNALADENPAASQNDKDEEEASGAQGPQAEKTAPGDEDLQDENVDNGEITGIQEISPDQKEEQVQEEGQDKKEKQDQKKKQDQEKQDGQAMQNDVPEGGATDDTYILPESDSRYYSWQEVDALDNDTLQMAINELYARHGRRFDNASIRSYFEKKSWYHPSIDPSAIDGKEDVYFNDYEKANYQLLLKVRAARTAPAPEQNNKRNHNNKENKEDEALTGYVGD